MRNECPPVNLSVKIVGLSGNIPSVPGFERKFRVLQRKSSDGGIENKGLTVSGKLPLKPMPGTLPAELKCCVYAETHGVARKTTVGPSVS
jgi:hypothetical protein